MLVGDVDLATNSMNHGEIEERDGTRIIHILRIPLGLVESRMLILISLKQIEKSKEHVTSR